MIHQDCIILAKQLVYSNEILLASKRFKDVALRHGAASIVLMYSFAKERHFYWPVN